MARTGAWKQRGNHVEVYSRVVYRTVVKVGKPIPEAETTETLKVRKGKYWTAWEDGRRYAKLLQLKDWGYLADLIRCDREYFDGEKRTSGVQPCMPQAQE